MATTTGTLVPTLTISFTLPAAEAARMSGMFTTIMRGYTITARGIIKKPRKVKRTVSHETETENGNEPATEQDWTIEEQIADEPIINHVSEVKSCEPSTEVQSPIEIETKPEYKFLTPQDLGALRLSSLNRFDPTYDSPPINIDEHQMKSYTKEFKLMLESHGVMCLDTLPQVDLIPFNDNLFLSGASKLNHFTEECTRLILEHPNIPDALKLVHCTFLKNSLEGSDKVKKNYDFNEVCKYFLHHDSKTPLYFAKQIENKFIYKDRVPDAEIIPRKKKQQQAYTAPELTVQEYIQYQSSVDTPSVPIKLDYNKTMREIGDVAGCALWVAGGVANGCKSLVANDKKKKKKANQKSYRKKK